MESQNRYVFKDGKFTTPKQEFGGKGMTFLPVQNQFQFLNVMQLIEATRTAKSHALNDRSSRSHCIV